MIYILKCVLIYTVKQLNKICYLYDFNVIVRPNHVILLTLTPFAYIDLYYMEIYFFASLNVNLKVPGNPVIMAGN